jgi:hypothetical protein
VVLLVDWAVTTLTRRRAAVSALPPSRSNNV